MLLLSIAGAADGPFVFQKTLHDCAIEKRAKTVERGAAMRATCHWPELEPVVLRRMFSDLSRYDEWIWPIGESRVERVEPKRLLVYQRQEIWGLADREVLLWVESAEVNGRLDVRWKAASEVPLVQAEGSVRPEINTGIWTLEPHPEGGTRAIHQIEASAGGLPLPRWLVKAIQTRGFARVMKDVRAKAVVEASNVPPSRL